MTLVILIAITININQQGTDQVKIELNIFLKDILFWQTDIQLPAFANYSYVWK